MHIQLQVSRSRPRSCPETLAPKSWHGLGVGLFKKVLTTTLPKCNRLDMVRGNRAGIKNGAAIQHCKRYAVE